MRCRAIPSGKEKEIYQGASAFSRAKRAHFKEAPALFSRCRPNWMPKAMYFFVSLPVLFAFYLENHGETKISPAL
jgi:hypothetical protein